MEFMNRGANARQTGQQPASQMPSQQNNTKSKKHDRGFVLRLISVVLLFSITVLLVAVAASFVIGPRKESNFVDSSKMQAVFLNGGQVYFGKITDLNDKYLRMEDIFYLRVNQVVQPNQQSNQQAQNDISLVKLGCELHRPSNEMLINRSQIVFWENLKDEEGENTVPGAVKNYKAQYPNGQECQEGAGTTNTNNSSNTQTTPTQNGNATEESTTESDTPATP